MNPPTSLTFPDLIAEQVALMGDGIAVIDQGKAYSYADLAKRAGRLAVGLRAAGLKRGDRIGILVSNRIEWLEIFFGATMAGAVVVPISTWSKPAELEFILNDAEISTLFTLPSAGREDFVAGLRSLVPEVFAAQKWVSARFPALRSLIMVGAEPPSAGWLSYEALFGDAATQFDLPPGEAVRPADDALILYTSGSTSKPKAVRLAHHGLIENGFNIGERQGLGREDRILAAVPLFWAYGSANAMPATITHGGALVLQERFEPGGALTLIEQHRCTAIYTLPAMTSALITHPEFAPARTSSLRTGLTIGNSQDVTNAAEVLGAQEICNVYGSSETYGNCCVTPCDWPLERRSACQGPPLPGVSVRLIDAETGAVAPSGTPGLIEVSGYLMPGYGGQSAIHNAQIFTDDGWYRTGDIGTFSDEGDIIFLGRDSEMIKRSGINVSPSEVEDIILQHLDVIQAAVVGAPDPERDEIIVCFVVCKHIVSEADLIAHCRTLASSYKVPDRIIFRSELPTTTTGKLLRQSLKAQALALTSQEIDHVT
jgi:fatty-acyl-CoA synthase